MDDYLLEKLEALSGEYDELCTWFDQECTCNTDDETQTDQDERFIRLEAQIELLKELIQ